MNRGAIYWINLEPASPPELGKIRPAIIVSSSTYDERLDSVVVIPLSTKAPEIWPLRLRLDLPKLKASFAVIPGVRQVSKLRLHDLIAQANHATLLRVEDALRLYLGA